MDTDDVPQFPSILDFRKSFLNLGTLGSFRDTGLRGCQQMIGDEELTPRTSARSTNICGTYDPRHYLGMGRGCLLSVHLPVKEYHAVRVR